MSLSEIWKDLLHILANTSWYEYVAVIAGIASVYFSRKENILVYPVGLINTIIYIYLSFEGGLLGEASVNLYYTIMSIYGWIIWLKKDNSNRPVLHITASGKKEWLAQLIFFSGFYLVIYFSLSYLKQVFFPGAIPWADALASASAFTGMWLMARKKIESWYWWIITNISSIPLYYVKGYHLTSFYYVVLLIMAFAGLAEWKRRAKVMEYAS